MLIVVGSTNKTKIDPVKEIFSKHFKNVEVRGVKVASGVAEQPMHEEEMYRGALNRAKAALEKVTEADFGVGIEGGTHKHSYGWFERSLVVIVNRKGEIGIGASGGLALPPKVIARLQKGETLEQTIDDLFGTKKIGEGIGMFGLLTKGVVSRTAGVAHGVAFALARFLHDGLYNES